MPVPVNELPSEPTQLYVILDIAKAVIALVGVIFTGMMAYFTAKLNVKAETAEKARAKSTLRLKNIAQVAKDINLQVHTSMAEQLKTSMELAEKVASYTKKPEDVIAAAQAKLRYEEHLAKTNDLTAPLATALDDSVADPS